jgi:NAD-dependent DNA ligase
MDEKCYTDEEIDTLTGILGIYNPEAKRLLEEFGSVSGVTQALTHELTKFDGIAKTTANKLQDLEQSENLLDAENNTQSESAHSSDGASQSDSAEQSREDTVDKPEDNDILSDIKDDFDIGE